MRLSFAARALALGTVVACACDTSKSTPEPSSSNTATGPTPSASALASNGAGPTKTAWPALPARPSSERPELWADARAHRRSVESGLLPPIGLTGVDLRMKLTDRMKRLDVPAIGVAVIDGGKVDWADSWGTLARPKSGDGTPANVETLFQAASLSKPVTAMTILALAQEGKLDLDRDVHTYLKTWRLPDPSTKPLTLRALLSHTGRVNAPEQAAYFDSSGDFTGYPRHTPMPTTLQLLKGEAPAVSAPVRLMAADAAPCADKPDPCFSYSGGGYLVLQLVIEETTGTTFPKAVANLVFAPLKMTHSSFEVEPPYDDVARAHSAKGDVPEGGWIAVGEKAGGGLWTTPEDIGRLVADLIAAHEGETGHVLTPEMAREMMKPVADARPVVIGSVGLGMFTTGTGDDLMFFHNGHNPGFHASFVGLPKQKKGMVVMTNTEAGPELMLEVARAIAAEYHWPESTGMLPKLKPPGKSSPATMRSLVGAYSGGFLLGQGLSVVVRLDGDVLFAKVDETEEVRLYPVSETDFVDPIAPAVLRFDTTKDAMKVIYDSPKGKRAADRQAAAP